MLMLNVRILTLILSLIFCQNSTSAQLQLNAPQKVERRLNELSSLDSLITYYRSCSGCISGINSSVLFLYRHKNRYTLEFYSWDQGNKKIVNHIVLKNKAKYISQLYKFASDNFNDLKQYDGYRDLSGETINKAQNDTATSGAKYFSYRDHGPEVFYEIKLGNKVIKTGASEASEIKYYIDKFPVVGTLLLLLNISFFQNGYLYLLDIQ